MVLCQLSSWHVHPTGWIAEVDVAWDASRILIEKLGKQHLGLASCISQSIGRRIAEISVKHKADLKQCLAIYRQYVQELNREKATMQKAKQKYERAVEDADQILHMRDKAASDSKDKAEPDGFIGKVCVCSLITMTLAQQSRVWGATRYSGNSLLKRFQSLKSE